MNPRRWWLLAGAVPEAAACAVAAADPRWRSAADAGLALSGVAVAAILWVLGGRRHQDRLGWRLLALSPLFPALGLLLGALAAPAQPLQLVVLRWVPTVPGYLAATVALLTFAGAARLRAGGLRPAVEAALFFTVVLLLVQLLLVGVDGSWAGPGPAGRVVLATAAVVASAMVAAAFVMLGAIECGRQRMALCALAGAAALGAGRALGTSAVLAGASGVPDISRFLIVGGLWLVVAAALLDPGPSERPPATPACRSTDLGQVLPHVAMALAAVVIGAVAVSGHPPSRATVGGVVVCAVLAAVHRWVSARDERRMAARLRRSEAYFRSLVNSSGDSVVVLDDNLRIGWTSPALERGLGTAAAGLAGRALLDAVHPEDAGAVATALAAPDADPADAPRGTGLLLLRLRDADGVWRYLEAGVSDLRSDPDVGAVVLHCRDMTERHAREQALQGVAYTDPRTGLPNRAAFQRLLEDALAPDRPPSTLLLIELDGLADARRHAGRDVVGTVVTEIGRRLRDTVRGEDAVARLGGGAFAVLAVGQGDDADRLAARCHAVIEQTVQTPAGIVDLTAGIGLADVEAGQSVDTVFGRVDLAVRQARAAGPGSTSRFRTALGEAALRRERLRAELTGACDRGELTLLFQPVIALEGQVVTGIEALVRWRHPELGEVLPAEFMPIAESAGLIGHLLRWVLEAATTATASLPDGAHPLRLGVDVPAAYVATGMLVGDVQHALGRSGLAPERLILEINEGTMLADDERAALDLRTLRLMGVHVALDGFGTGGSTLGHLTQLPLDVLKLDRSLISRIDRDPQSRALCESIVGIGRALGLDVVAEGVETTGQLAALSAFGCGFAQGFLISRPMPLTALLSALRAGAAQLWPGVESRV
ncbi:MAG TPA: EAL domain-containing protein [Blastococcus sp.]|nr:EAL domain-containing protein [Blastococcus sp.]